MRMVGGKEAYKMPCSVACFLNDKQFICRPIMESPLDTLSSERITGREEQVVCL